MAAAASGVIKNRRTWIDADALLFKIEKANEMIRKMESIKEFDEILEDLESCEYKGS